MQYVVREETEIGRRGAGAGEFAGQMQVLGDDVEGAAGGKDARQHRARMLSKVRLAPALNGTIGARMPGSTPALAPISRPSSAAMKLV
jgi:hypothetical protein